MRHARIDDAATVETCLRMLNNVPPQVAHAPLNAAAAAAAAAFYCLHKHTHTHTGATVRVYLFVWNTCVLGACMRVVNERTVRVLYAYAACAMDNGGRVHQNESNTRAHPLRPVGHRVHRAVVLLLGQYARSRRRSCVGIQPQSIFTSSLRSYLLVSTKTNSRTQELCV